MALWTRLAVAVVSAAVVAGGGYALWKRRQPALAQAEAPPRPAAAQPAASVPSMPAVRYPIDDVAAEPARLPSSPGDADRFVADALAGLLGRQEVQGFLQIDGFVRRAVATLDNLGRAQAPAHLWPVHPMSGRYGVIERNDGLWPAETNALRYEAFMRFVLAIDTGKAAALYVRLYPLFQREYEALGYPGHHFNDRLVDVIDLLLQTPQPAAAPKLKLTRIQGPIAGTRPWLRYEFDDEALEARPAGQKILLRMGEHNERLLKDKLRDFRAHIVKAR